MPCYSQQVIYMIPVSLGFSFSALWTADLKFSIYNMAEIYMSELLLATVVYKC